MMIGNVSDAYNDYKIYPYTLGNDRADKDSAVSSSLIEPVVILQITSAVWLSLTEGFLITLKTTSMF